MTARIWSNFGLKSVLDQMLKFRNLQLVFPNCDALRHRMSRRNYCSLSVMPNENITIEFD